jgi:molybdenum cofactor guanylyltransferase
MRLAIEHPFSRIMLWNRRMNFGVVLLAGGEGRRIGGGKPSRLLAGRSLAEWTLSAARAWSEDIRVAVRPGDGADAFRVPPLYDDPSIEGPLAGVASALRHAQSTGLDAVLTIPCDTPFLPADLADRLSLALGGVGAALASSGGALHPTCGLWAREAVEALPDYRASGRRSIRGFAAEIGHEVVDWEIESFDPFFNINDPADLEQAEACLRLKNR